MGIKQFRAIAFACASVSLMGFVPAQEPAPSQALTITDVYCLSNGTSSMGGNTGSCRSTVTGSTGTITYSWSPQPVLTSDGSARIPCTPGTYQYVTLTVTDSSNATDSATTWFYCGEAP